MNLVRYRVELRENPEPQTAIQRVRTLLAQSKDQDRALEGVAIYDDGEGLFLDVPKPELRGRLEEYLQCKLVEAA